MREDCILKKKVTFQGREYIIEILKNGRLRIDGKIYSPNISQSLQNVYKVIVNDQTLTVEVTGNNIMVDGEESSLSVKPYFPQITKKINEKKSENLKIKAPIPGKIIQILAKEGDDIEKDQELLILVAMKMRNRIFAPSKGKISKIFVNRDETVSQDQILIEIKR